MASASPLPVTTRRRRCGMAERREGNADPVRPLELCFTGRDLQPRRQAPRHRPVTTRRRRCGMRRTGRNYWTLSWPLGTLFLLWFSGPDGKRLATASYGPDGEGVGGGGREGTADPATATRAFVSTVNLQPRWASASLPPQLRPDSEGVGCKEREGTADPARPTRALFSSVAFSPDGKAPRYRQFGTKTAKVWDAGGLGRSC